MKDFTAENVRAMMPETPDIPEEEALIHNIKRRVSAAARAGQDEVVMKVEKYSLRAVRCVILIMKKNGFKLVYDSNSGHLKIMW